jgi:nucleoside-diphosphate-sugar epimerase
LFWRTTTVGSGQPVDVLQDPEVKKAWGHLRRFACFHLAEHTFASQQQLEAAVDAAQQELLEYCKLAEQVRPLGFLGGTSTTVGRAYAQLGGR